MYESYDFNINHMADTTVISFVHPDTGKPGEILFRFEEPNLELSARRRLILETIRRDMDAMEAFTAFMDPAYPLV